jgi:predicted alpha/beta superfamily hydrolase
MSTKKIEYSNHPFLIAKGIRVPNINRRRKVWAFLPSDYFINKQKHYPVIYFNDGQNIFEGWKAAFGKSWEAHNTMRQLSPSLPNESILIGVEHGKKYRKGEYMPFDALGNMSFEGNVYADFVANDLKNYVDKKLRTLVDRENTAIIGSSLGGLCALYIAFKHQDVFSKVGVLSPSLWAAPCMNALIKKYGKHFAMQFYLGIGSKEGKKNIQNVIQLHSTLKSVGYSDAELQLHIVKDGKHDEDLWRSEFANFYKWLKWKI